MGSRIDNLLIDTRLMVAEVIMELLSNHKRNQIQWELGVLPSVNGDFNTIRQVWVNLISNAIKYCRKEEKPRIRIGSFLQEDRLAFFVEENGTNQQTFLI